jgi:hypothetical protein
VSLGLDDVDLGDVVRRFGLKLPVAVEGRLSCQVQATLPLDKPEDTKAYRIRGTARLSRLNLAGIEMADVRTRLHYADGVLQLDELSGQLPRPRRPGVAAAAGTFTGSARYQMVPAGELRGQLRVEGVPLDVVLNRLPRAAGQANGDLSGRVEFRAPPGKLNDPAGWEATGALTSESVRLYGLTLRKASAGLKLRKGVVGVQALKADLEGAPLTGTAALHLDKSYRYQAQLELARADLGALQRLLPDLRPPVAVRGRLGIRAEVRGTLSPATATVAGTAEATELHVDQVRVDALTCRWALADALTLSDVRGRLYQGTVTGSAVVPWDDSAAGRADLHVDGVDARALTAALPAVPVRLEGTVSGRLTGELTAAAPGRPRTATGRLDLTAPRLRVQNVPAERLKGTVDYRAGRTEYRLEGAILGGVFRLEGVLPPPREEKEEAQPPPDGRFRLEGARLSRLGDALGLSERLAPLRGRVDVDLPYRFEGPDRRPVGTGRLVITNLRWGDQELSDSLRGDLRLTGQDVQLRNLDAALGEGTLRGQVVWNLRQPDRSWFTLTLDRVEAARLLAPLPDVAAQVQGPMELHLRGNLGREWRGGGTLVLARGKVLGLEVAEWRLPLDFVLTLAQGTGRLDVHESHAQVGQGRAVGQAHLRWGDAPRLNGSLRFFNADLRTLLRSYNEVNSYAAGRVTGRLDFAASNLRSVEDLTATLDATLSEAQALQLPVLLQLVPFVAPGRATTTFQSGDLHARLSNGVVRVQRLSLTSPLLQLLVVGTITTQGRLDLDATGRTGTLGVSPAALRVLGLRIPAAGPIPLAVIAQATSYLSNRLVHVRVTGTVRNPSVRVEPLVLLTEEAVRFFLGQAGVPVP